MFLPGRTGSKIVTLKKEEQMKMSITALRNYMKQLQESLKEKTNGILEEHDNIAAQLVIENQIIQESLQTEVLPDITSVQGQNSTTNILQSEQ